MEETHKFKYFIKINTPEGNIEKVEADIDGSVEYLNGILKITLMEEDLTTVLLVDKKEVKLSKDGIATVEQVFQTGKQTEGRFEQGDYKVKMHVFTNYINILDEGIKMEYIMFVDGKDAGVTELEINYKEKGGS